MALKSNADLFIQEMKRRNITQIIHFTTTKNLLNMFEQGAILSRNILTHLSHLEHSSLEIVNYTDEMRFDDTNYINCSISCHNTFLFNAFKKRHEDDPAVTWCMLKINPSLLYDENTLFSVSNAGSREAQNYGIHGDFTHFKNLFADNLPIRYNSRVNTALQYPTSVQAECLIKDRINLGDVIQVCFQNESDCRFTRNIFISEGYNVDNFVIDSDVFNPDRSI